MDKVELRSQAMHANLHLSQMIKLTFRTPLEASDVVSQEHF